MCKASFKKESVELPPALGGCVGGQGAQSVELSSSLGVAMLRMWSCRQLWAGWCDGWSGWRGGVMDGGWCDGWSGVEWGGASGWAGERMDGRARRRPSLSKPRVVLSPRRATGLNAMAILEAMLVELLDEVLVPLPAPLLTQLLRRWERLRVVPNELLASYVVRQLLDEDPLPWRSRPPLSYCLRRVVVVEDLPVVVPPAREVDVRAFLTTPRRERERHLVASPEKTGPPPLPLLSITPPQWGSA